MDLHIFEPTFKVCCESLCTAVLLAFFCQSEMLFSILARRIVLAHVNAYLHRLVVAILFGIRALVLFVCRTREILLTNQGYFGELLMKLGIDPTSRSWNIFALHADCASRYSFDPPVTHCPSCTCTSEIHLCHTSGASQRPRCCKRAGATALLDGKLAPLDSRSVQRWSLGCILCSVRCLQEKKGKGPQL